MVEYIYIYIYIYKKTKPSKRHQMGEENTKVLKRCGLPVVGKISIPLNGQTSNNRNGLLPCEKNMMT